LGYPEPVEVYIGKTVENLSLYLLLDEFEDTEYINFKSIAVVEGIPSQIVENRHYINSMHLAKSF
jgi:hypothetical protein